MVVRILIARISISILIQPCCSYSFGCWRVISNSRHRRGFISSNCCSSHRSSHRSKCFGWCSSVRLVHSLIRCSSDPVAHSLRRGSSDPVMHKTVFATAVVTAAATADTESIVVSLTQKVSIQWCRFWLMLIPIRTKTSKNVFRGRSRCLTDSHISPNL